MNRFKERDMFINDITCHELRVDVCVKRKENTKTEGRVGADDSARQVAGED